MVAEVRIWVSKLDRNRVTLTALLLDNSAIILAMSSCLFNGMLSFVVVGCLRVDATTTGIVFASGTS